MILYLPEWRYIGNVKDIWVRSTCVQAIVGGVPGEVVLQRIHFDEFQKDLGNATEEEADKVLQCITHHIAANGKCTRIHVGEILETIRKKETV